jgi:hypothetical protein
MLHENNRGFFFDIFFGYNPKNLKLIPILSNNLMLLALKPSPLNNLIKSDIILPGF